MLRLTHVVVLVALGSVVVAGPAVRRDEVQINVVTLQDGEGTTPKPVTVESASTVPKVDPAVPVKLPVAADEQTSEPTTVKAPQEEQSSSTNPPEVSTTTTTTVVASSSVAPTTSLAPTIPAASTTKPPRKTITFDQRQEGKYNIRADLENFVIVVVPSGSSSGASLLDFLTRSAQKKDAYHHHHHHHQTRKHNAANGKRKNTKAQYAGAPKKKVPQGLVTPEVIVLDESNQRSGQLAVEEFIEGRTPYKVDLSSSARSVDDEEVSEPQQQSSASFRFSVEPSSTVEARSSGRVRFPQVASA
uniref:Uncharacterized protein n=1 Tax=Anopheles atroparvus TaxID=41427 RepID=A0AAG5D7R0_ANOAO